MPCWLRATSGTCRRPSSRAISAVPCSLPNKMISGLGSSFVQLVIALRWITPMCPWNGFNTAQTVIRGEARESGGLRVLRLTRRVTP